MIINLKASTRIQKLAICLYNMGIVALLESSYTIMMVHKAREIVSPSKTIIVYNKTK